MPATRQYPDYKTLSARELEAYIIELRQLLESATASSTVSEKKLRELEEELSKAERYTGGNVRCGENKEESTGH